VNIFKLLQKDIVFKHQKNSQKQNTIRKKYVLIDIEKEKIHHPSK